MFADGRGKGTAAVSFNFHEDIVTASPSKLDTHTRRPVSSAPHIASKRSMLHAARQGRQPLSAVIRARSASLEVMILEHSILQCEKRRRRVPGAFFSVTGKPWSWSGGACSFALLCEGLWKVLSLQVEPVIE